MKICFPWWFSLRGPDVERSEGDHESVNLKDMLFIITVNGMVV